MGIAAPAAAVLAAAIPMALGMIWQGLPGAAPLLGFVLAGTGIWLMARPDASSGRPDGLVMALVAGLGFAGFFVCIHQAGASSAIWLAALSRLGSLVLVTSIVTFRWNFRIRLRDALLGVGAGCLDSTGTMFFIRAQQTGRLDSAVIVASLYPAVTVLLARLILREHFTRWKAVGILAALGAVPLIAMQ
jgi:drug/metabolite transporter (DMT)-like permease